MALTFTSIITKINAAKKKLRSKANKKQVRRKMVDGYYSKIARKRKAKVPSKPETEVSES